MAYKFYSHVRKEEVEVSRLYSENGFLLLRGDLEMWIQSTPADRLSSVRCLELYLLSFGGEAIGDSIGKLSELTHLCIRREFFCNNLKFLPNTISRLHKLQKLELRGFHNLDLPADLGDLQSLTSVSLHDCPSLKFLPDSVAKLSKLTSLTVSRCRKLEELPADLGDLQSLTSMSLHECWSLKFLPDSVAKLSKLKSLSVSGGLKLEELPVDLGDLQSLTSVSLHDCWILKFLPDSVAKLSKLKSLSVIGCDELEELPADLGDLQSLTSVSLHACWSLKFLPDSVAKLSKLTSLSVSDCDKLEELPANLGDLQSLTSVSLHYCTSLKFLPDSVAKLSKLTSLSVIGCRKLEELPADLGDLQSLTSVSLHDCCSLKFLLDSVAKLSKLKSLSVIDCEDLEELPANLGDLQSLTYLGLYGCKCLKSLPRSIAKLSKLRCLTLPMGFRLYTLPPHMNDPLLISVKRTSIRKTWKALKSEMELLSIPLPLSSDFPVNATPFLLAPGYLRLKGDPAPWIESNYNLLPLVRLLELDLEDNIIARNVPLSLVKLPNLTHLYIQGYLTHLSPTFLFQRTSHLSLTFYDLDYGTESRLDSLGNLSKLLSLHLILDEYGEFPACMYLPVSLRYLSLSSRSWKLKCFPLTYKSMIANLYNLETLDLCGFCDLDLLPSNLHLTKLVLRESTIKSLPMGLQHLEIMHRKAYHDPLTCDDLSECLNQLVNLETLSYTCKIIKFLPSITSLPNLQELHLKDCFNLKELPSNLDELVKLGTLDVSGTRIKSLPNSITKLHNLRHLILPKCFMLESLPQCFRKEVMISVDKTPKQYYMNQGYYDSDFYEHCDDSSDDEGNEITSGTMEEVNEVVVKESTTKNIMEKQVQQRHLSHLPDAIQISEGSCFPGRIDPISNDSHYASSDVQNHEMDILPAGNTMQVYAPIELDDSHVNGGINAAGENSLLTLPSNRDCVAASVHNIAAESSSILHVTSLFGENSQEAFQNEQMDNTNLEMQQGTTPRNSIISDHGGSNYHASKNKQNNNPRSGKVKSKTQKIEIALETINSLMSQNIRVVDAAKQLGVSRSTLKRALKEYDITWPSSRKRKLQAPSNSAGHSHVAEHLDGSNRVTLSDHVPSEYNGVNNPKPDAVIRTVNEPPISNGVEECALGNSVQPNGSSSTFVVKAAYKKDIARFNFSLSSSIEQLKEEVGKSLELEVGKFKIKYQDDEKEWVLMHHISDLEDALSLSKSSGSNVVRLSIELKE